MKTQAASPDQLCARIAERQDGIITASQARSFGMDRARMRRRVASGKWERVLPDVYRLRGSAVTWRQIARAGLAWAGPGSALSHTSAAAELDLGDFQRWGQIEISTTQDQIIGNRLVVVHRVRRLERRDIIQVNGLAITTAALTLLDLGQVARARSVERAMDDALHRHLSSIPLLKDVLERHGKRGRAGTALLRKLVAARDEPGGAANGFEARLFALLRRAGFPPPVQQHSIYQDGRFLARPDLCFPDKMIIIEADSYRWHSNPLDWRRDQIRHNSVTAIGYLVLRFTWADFCNPQEFLDHLRKAWAR